MIQTLQNIQDLQSKTLAFYLRNLKSLVRNDNFFIYVIELLFANYQVVTTLGGMFLVFLLLLIFYPFMRIYNISADLMSVYYHPSYKNGEYDNEHKKIVDTQQKP